MKIEFRNKQLDLSTPAVMGILNITSDSFYDGGKFTDEKSIINHCRTMIEEGADIIDVGACSTRPQATLISEEEEIKKLIPTIKNIRKAFPDIIISADTFRSKAATQAVQAGADMINDISGGGFEEEQIFFKTIASLNVPYILMHIQGSPATMQVNPHYKNVVEEVKTYFINKIQLLKTAGIKQIILDPGFGFGKNTEHNYTLLKELHLFTIFGFPILAGVSRKSMINKVIGSTPATALNGTSVVNTIALMTGANILRVHDVREAKEAVKIINFIKNLK